jgi:hypothetical protein
VQAAYVMARPSLRASTAPVDEKPWRLLSSMYDESFRPTIRSLADALAAMDRAAFDPIGELRGGASDQGIWHKRKCALTWIEGETACERFRVAIPVSTEFTGWDKRGHRYRQPISDFDGAIILRDGSLRLEKNLWVQRVRFIFPHLTFLLTGNQRYIARLVSEFQNPCGGELSLRPIDYSGLATTEITSLRAVTEFVRSNWNSLVTGSPPPSRETIASTLEALFARARTRERHS